MLTIERREIGCANHDGTIRIERGFIRPGDEHPRPMERDLRQVTLHLWRSQFVYESDWGSKTHYDLIRRHRAYFENLFDALGYRVVVDPMHGVSAHKWAVGFIPLGQRFSTLARIRAN